MDKIKTEIAEKLAPLTLDIIYKKPPFDELYWPEGVGYDLIRNLQLYIDEIPQNLLNCFHEYIRKVSLFHFNFALGIHSPQPFTEQYSDLYNAYQEVVKWHRDRKGDLMPFIIGGTGFPSPFKINPIIAKTIKSRYPDAKPAKEKPVRGVRTYYTNHKGNKLFIGFERGNLRSFMSLFFGFEKPWFMVDIANFFLTPQSRFDYIPRKKYNRIINGEMRAVYEQQAPSPSDVVSMVNEAIDLMEDLLPHVMNCLSDLMKAE